MNIIKIVIFNILLLMCNTLYADYIYVLDKNIYKGSILKNESIEDLNLCGSDFGECLSGNSTYTSLIGSSNVTWKCNDKNKYADCSKNANLGIDAQCGTSNGKTFSQIPITNLCLSGDSTDVILNSGKYQWSCEGSIGDQITKHGVNVNCESNKSNFEYQLAASRGTFINRNTIETINYAFDNDLSTETNNFEVAYRDSYADIRLRPLIEVLNKKITIHWKHYASPGYGQYYHLLIQVKDNGVWRALHNGNTYAYSWTNRSISVDVVKLEDIQIRIYDVAGGAPYLRIRDIIVE